MAKRQCLFGLLLLLTPNLTHFFQTASAQSVGMGRSADRAVWLEVQKPNFTKEYLGGDFFDPPLKTTFATSVVFLSARWRISGPFALRTEIPFAGWGYDSRTVIIPTTLPALDTFRFPGFSETGFGNPLLGLQLGGKSSPLFAEISIRFPLARIRVKPGQKVGSLGNSARAAGRVIDYDRTEAFWEDAWTLGAAAEYQLSAADGFLLRLRAGSVWILSIGDYSRFSENEFFADYGLQSGYQKHRFTLLGGITSRVLLSADYDLGYSDRAIHHLNFVAGYSFGNLEPLLTFRIPVDDELRTDLDFVLGVSIGYRFSKPFKADAGKSDDVFEY